MRKTVGIISIYLAAVLITLSIIFLFKIIRFNFAYTTAAAGFFLYIMGLFLTKEGKFSPYRIAMIVISLILIFVAILREVV